MADLWSADVLVLRLRSNTNKKGDHVVALWLVKDLSIFRTGAQRWEHLFELIRQRHHSNG
jgi:hypothetical protein